MHLITNNQVGFTTDPDDARSTRWASDLAKGFDVPIIHVNADDVPACMSAVRLAFAFRQEFGHDVLIDLIGYRRFGHNESDEPAYTQPEMYAKIKSKKRVAELWAERLVAEGVVSQEEVERQAQEVWDNLTLLHQRLKAKIAAAAEQRRRAHAPASTSSTARRAPTSRRRCPPRACASSATQLLRVPEGFTVHPKLVKQLDRRREALAADAAGTSIDWAHAEALAFASLLTEGTPVRLTGQDTERGTFSQRHMVLHDAKTGQTVCPIQNLPERARPAGAAQQPAVGARVHGLRVRLQPGGARDARAVGGAVRRLRQLGAGDRRPVHRLGPGQVGPDLAPDAAAAARLRGLGPRALLRAPRALPRARRRGQHPRREPDDARAVLPPAAPPGAHRQAAPADRDDAEVAAAPAAGGELGRRPGRGHALPAGARRAGRATTSRSRAWCCAPARSTTTSSATPSAPATRGLAVARVELLYPFPEGQILELMGSYPNLREVVWVQEEPRNMGARAHMFPRLMQIMPPEMHFGYIGRPERASPGEGYPAAHIDEQNRIVTTAIDLASRSRSTRARPRESADGALWRRFRRSGASAGASAASATAASARSTPAQRPFHTGSRFSLKAFAPSLASSEANTGPEIAPCFSHISSLDQSNCSCRIAWRRPARAARWRRAARGQLERHVDRRAGLGEAVDEPELVEALGGERVAGQRQLHDDVVGHPPRQAQQRAAGGDERALGLGDAHLRALRGDDQVAGQRDLHAARHREALDRGDQRLARGALGDARRSRGRRTTATRP